MSNIVQQMLNTARLQAAVELTFKKWSFKPFPHWKDGETYSVVIGLENINDGPLVFTIIHHCKVTMHKKQESWKIVVTVPTIDPEFRWVAVEGNDKTITTINYTETP